MTQLATFVLFLFSFNSFAGLHISTFNIKNFGEEARSTQQFESSPYLLAQTLKSLNSDLIALQEIVDEYKLKDLIKKYMPSKKLVITECGGFNGQKLGFLYNPYRFELKSFFEDLSLTKVSDQREESCDRSSRPAAIGNFKDLKEKKQLLILNVHLKAGGLPEDIDKRSYQLGNLKKLMKSLLEDRGHQNFIIMGDFNSTEYKLKKQEYQNLVKFASSLKMSILDKDIECSNYWTGEDREDQIFYPSHLDHILMSYSLKNQYGHTKTKTGAHCARSYCKIKTEEELGSSFAKVSDHCPVSSSFAK